MPDIQVTLHVSPAVYQRAQRLAALTQRGVNEVLVDAIVLDEIDEGALLDVEVARERTTYLALHPLLLEKYPGEQVAIYHGQLVDHDKDGVALSLRIYARFPDEFVWIAPVKSEPLEEWVVRSPRFEALAN